MNDYQSAIATQFAAQYYRYSVAQKTLIPQHIVAEISQFVTLYNNIERNFFRLSNINLDTSFTKPIHNFSYEKVLKVGRRKLFDSKCKMITKN